MARGARFIGPPSAPRHRIGARFAYLVAPSGSAVALDGTISAQSGTGNSAGAIVIVPNSGTASLTQLESYRNNPKRAARTVRTVALPSGVTSGGLLVVMITQGTTTGRTVTGCGATWARAKTAAQSSIIVDIWIGRNPTAGQTTVTVTDSGATNSRSITVAEFAGCDNTVTSWTTNSKINTTTVGGHVGTNSVTPSSGQLVVALWECNFITDGYPPTSGAGTATISWADSGTWTALKGSTP